MKFATLGLLILILLAAAGCGDAAPTATSVPPPAAAVPAGASTAGHITVQHILISFKGKLPGKPITRTQEEARVLAHSLFDRAKSGADFDQLVKANTDDAWPGIYSMSDTGLQPNQGESPRDGMVPAFGNVGFTLQPGGIGIAEYDATTSPYGYHIIKRLR